MQKKPKESLGFNSTFQPTGMDQSGRLSAKKDWGHALIGKTSLLTNDFDCPDVLESP